MGLWRSISVAMASPARSKLKGRRPSPRPESADLNGARHGRPAPVRRPLVEEPAATPAALVHELGSCVTEADLVQVLYRGLHPLFGYDVINLHVLEREGWFHSLPMDSGVLQDVRRRPLRESVFSKQYANPRSVVIPLDPKRQEAAKGPGAGRQTKFAIWVPIEHQGEVIGSVIYQSRHSRRVPPTEITFLDDVHRRLAVLLANDYLDEAGRIDALLTPLSQLLPMDVLHMAAMESDQPDRVRLLNVQADSAPTPRWLAIRSSQLGPVRAIVRDPEPLLTLEPTSALWVT